MPIDRSEPGTFADMRLVPGMRVQLLLKSPERPRVVVRLLGHAPGEFLIARPLAANGGVPEVMIGTAAAARLVSGVHFFNFDTAVIANFPAPAGYWHLAFPDSVESTMFRSSPRVDVDIPAQAVLASGVPCDVGLGDIGAGGALLKSHTVLGSVGDTLTVTFRLPGADHADVVIECRIRSCRDPVEAGARKRFGVEWLLRDDLSRLRVENFVYEQLIESRSGS